VKNLTRVVLALGFLLCFVVLGSSIASAQDCADEDRCAVQPTTLNLLTGLAGGVSGVVVAAFIALRFRKLRDPSGSGWCGVIGEDLTGTESLPAGGTDTSSGREC
jgi:hypothetical protein